MLFKINRIIHKKIQYSYKIKQKKVILNKSKIIIINNSIKYIYNKKITNCKTIKNYKLKNNWI